MRREGSRWMLTLLLAAGCREPATAPVRHETPADAGPSIRGPAVVLHPQGRGLVVVPTEVARTEAVRNQGLMYRRELADGSGMLFVFARPGHHAFWMRNTLIPLDMIFIDSQRHVVGVVHSATPETDDPREVPGTWLYVLEVAGGQARRWGIRAGDAVELVGVQPAFE